MTRIGKYEIIEKLGAGSMGVVYRAHDTTLDREVALKTIRTGPGIEPELRERFYREARACARLQHPSIIIVFDLGEADGVAYIAMELLRGADFRKLIDQKAQVPLAAKVEAMAQICEALAYAHRDGLIHRDIKPSNLFLTETNQAKVLDFGIARLPSSKLTMAGNILGTPNYMAPEQILARSTDSRADLFSAAVVFFEFVTCVHPFQSDSVPRRIIQTEPDSLFSHNPDLPVSLRDILEKGLAKEPDSRYQSGDQFARDLRELLAALRNSAPRSPYATSVDQAMLFGPHSPPQSEEVMVSSPPSREDPDGWRLAEVVRLGQEFHKSLEVRNITEARRLLDQLESLSASDTRFSDAVQLCKDKFALVAAANAPAPSPRPPALANPGPPKGDPPSARKHCSECGASNRSAAAYCIQCGVAMPASPAAGPSIPAGPPILDTKPFDQQATSLFRPLDEDRSLTNPQADVPVITSPQSPRTEANRRAPVESAVVSWWKRPLDWLRR